MVPTAMATALAEPPAWVADMASGTSASTLAGANPSPGRFGGFGCSTCEREGLLLLITHHHVITLLHSSNLVWWPPATDAHACMLSHGYRVLKGTRKGAKTLACSLALCVAATISGLPSPLRSACSGHA